MKYWRDQKRFFYPLIFYNTTPLCKLLNRSGGLFYLLILSRLVCLLHKLSNRSNGIFYLLALLWLTYSLCERLNRSDETFYFLTLDGSIICKQLELDDDHRDGMYITNVSALFWFTQLVSLTCRFHSNFCFKTFERRSCGYE